MPLTNPPIKPGDNKSKIKVKPKNDIGLENEVELRTPIENIDSRKEFFRLMAEKIKDKDFNINQAMAMKEEVNRKEQKLEEAKEVKEENSFDNKSEENSINEEEFIVEEDSPKAKEEYKIEIEEEKENNKDLRSIVLYKKMIYRFLFLVGLLLLAVFYFSFVSMTIIVYPEQGSTNSSLNFYASTDNDQSNLDRAIKASITKIEVEERGTFQSTGQKDLGGTIVGRVEIINEYSKNQPLVATTRLLSSDDKLFRIKETVNVPAGGSVEVDIYADSISEDMAIGPDTFIIPGLWTGIQDKIYAKSNKKFEYITEDKKYITEKDINSAIDSLNQKITNQANSKAKEAIDFNRSYVLDINLGSSIASHDKKIGDEVASFELSVKNIINVISFETENLISLAKQKVSMETNKDISEINANSLNFELISFNTLRNLAEIKAEFSARTSVVVDDFINKKHLSNLNKKQVEAYLDNIKEIQSYELVFKPNFMKRSPILLDKIIVEYR